MGIIKPVLTGVLALALSGCVSDGQKKQIQKFSKATDTLVNKSDQLYSTSLKSNEKKEVLSIANKIDRDEDNVLEKLNKIFDKGLFSEGITARKELLNLLKNYANGLNQLANDDESESIGKSTKSLLKSTDKYTEGLKKDEKKLLGQAINGLGTIILETMRSHSLRSNVSNAQAHIQEICKILISDISNRSLKGKLTKEFKARKGILHGQYINSDSFEVRERLIIRLASLVKLEKDVNKVLKELEHALAAFKKAHNQMNESLKLSNIFGSYNSLKDQVDALVHHSKKLDNFKLEE